MTEVWKTVADVDGYEVSDLGRVRSWIMANSTRRRTEPKVLRQQSDKDGYAQVNLRNRTKKVHHLVLKAFVGPRPDGMEASHNNGRRADNRLENLRWGTPKENNADKLVHGTVLTGDRSPSRVNRHLMARGEAVYGSKLTAGQVRVISMFASLAPAERPSMRAIADTFGVGGSTVRDIWLGNRWRHVLPSSVQAITYLMR